MKRIMIGLAASAAALSLSTGAFACAQLDKSRSADSTKAGSIILAQATGGGAATGGGGPAVSEPAEKAGGKRKTETEAPSAPATPGATDTTGQPGAVDASQAKRKDTTEPAQSGAK